MRWFCNIFFIFCASCGIEEKTILESTDSQTEEEKENCAKYGYAGKCEENILYYCESGVWETIDCTSANGTCEWDEQFRYYICRLPKNISLENMCFNIGERHCDESNEKMITECVFDEKTNLAVWQTKECNGGDACTIDLCNQDQCVSAKKTCPANQYCKNGKCVCKPSCAYKECGSDNCGGKCGICAENEECNAIGKCFSLDKDNDGVEISQDNCPQDYNPNQEDIDNDGLGDVCDVCTPDCSNSECGPDGCGGSCGECMENMVCVDNDYCAPPDCLGTKVPTKNSCTDVKTYEGCCDESGRVIWCEKGATYCLDCANLNPSCGWLIDTGFYDCGTNGAVDPSGNFPQACVAECLPDCLNKQCGSDNCNGNCGECPSNYQCENGACEELPPRPPEQPSSPPSQP